MKKAKVENIHDGALTTIEITTILSMRTKHGMVELALNEEKTQMDVGKAREVAGMLHEAVEAAISDELIWLFLTTKVGLPDEQAAMMLVEFRALRQGGTGVVYPS